MACVSKSTFLKPLRLKTERYSIPEYGEGAYVIVRALTSKDLLALQETYGKTPNSSNTDFLHDALSRALVDDSGNPIFESGSDCKAGMEMSLPAMESLLEVVFRVSGIETKRDGEKN